MIEIALALAKGLPWLAGLLAGPKAEVVAEKVIGIAQDITGKKEPDAALKAIQTDPALAFQYSKVVMDQKVDLERLAVENANEINETMRAEAKSEHWQTYSWRPAIGFAVAVNVLLTSLVVAFAFAGVILFSRDATVLQYVPSMIGAMAALVGVVAPILGIASWFRGKMQAEANGK